MNGFMRLYPLKLLEFVLVAVLSTLLFAVLAAIPSGVASLLADVTPLPWEPTTTVAVFIGVAFGAGFGLISRFPPIERSSEESVESTDDGFHEYDGDDSIHSDTRHLR